MATLTRAQRDELADRIVELDPVFEPVVEAVGPPPALRSTPPDERFATLVSSVVAQLLSVKAGDTIANRIVDACGGEITTDAILALSHDELRATGVSNAKAVTIRDLAVHVSSGSLELARHGRMHDDEVLRELVAVRGIGEWTAHMYLLFTLGRPDVWPVGDLGVRDGWSLLHGIDPMIPARDLLPAGEPFHGFRSAVAWYCWRARRL